MKPSQLLQSNVVIWVEGPSDKIYIKTWLESKAALSNIYFIEGKDYSFVGLPDPDPASLNGQRMTPLTNSSPGSTPEWVITRTMPMQ